ncbi:amino acid adenylation domain-containing protein, partial [Myxococcaceae bacterium JPH2]|nr:amino acid adenylation domain-containing protein [Myxococcaceae bacterium JPH2]
MSSDLSKRIANLSPEKRAELLKKVAAQKAAAGNTARGTIAIQDRSRPLPLSFAQQRLWFVDQLEPGTSLYNVPMAVRMEGVVDVALLERALLEVTRRHEVLRTTFVEEGTGPVQRVAPEPTLALEVRDVTGASDEALWDAAREVAARPFQLNQGPLMRALLLQRGAKDHLLTLVIHHIISDGWSMNVLVREVAMLYGSFARNLPSPLPPLPIQYADYGVWQREWLQGEVLDKHVTYWKQQLAAAPPALELYTDKLRPAKRSGAGARHDFHLSRELMEGLKALGQREGASLFMVLLAGWQVLLARYAGQEDVSVGSPMAGRARGETEGLIGFFVNTLVLRTQVESTLPFRTLLARVRETVLGAQEHQGLPFERLVEALQPERIQGRSPLFQVMFTLQASLGAGPVSVEGVKLEASELDTRTSKFDLVLQVLETERGLQAFLEYDTDIFLASTIQRMVEHLRVLLEGAVARPDETVARLPMITAAERVQVISTWNPPLPAPLGWHTQHASFEAQAQRTPDRIAVYFGDASLTYAQLEARASQLARYLVRLGVGPDVRVGLCVERSLELIVAVIAVLKAGGSYVPLDPAFPADRLAYTIEDTGMPVVVTQRSLMSTLPQHSARVVMLDEDAAAIAREDASPLRIDVPADCVAYVIYTSGSTGRPKGVQVPHGGVARFLEAIRATTGFSERDVIVAVTTLSFDIHVLELFLPLMVGGQVVIVPRDVAMDGKRLGAVMKARGVTVLQCTPSTWRLLLEAGWDGRGLMGMIGGEALPRDLADSLLALDTALWNVYGPTETTVWCTAHLAEPGKSAIPIGSPMAGTLAYVLDESLQPVPPGVPGELYLAGEGVTRGYLGREDLTADRFLPALYGATPGGRMYRTGDRVRWSARGALEYLNRVDNQVKVRGYRIELGEIEAVLRENPSVRDAAVIVRGEGADKRILGYAAPRPGHTLDALVLRANLKARLPEYMVPAVVTVMDALPLTPTGKIDRKALPTPDAPQSERQHVAPRTPTETLLASIWSEVLKVPQVGVIDSFFELGGHSLLATQVMSRVRTSFAVELPLQAFFETPTVEALAQRIDTLLPTASLAMPLGPSARDAALPLSFAQQRLWLIDQLDARNTAYNLPSALHLHGRVDVESLRRAFEALIERHESLRTTFAEHEGEPVQVIQPPARWALEVTDLSYLPEPEREAEVRRRATHEASQPFSLASGPLLRTALLRLSEEHHVL